MYPATSAAAAAAAAAMKSTRVIVINLVYFFQDIAGHLDHRPSSDA